jgi:O-antigen/teichoic acid export membrane protein
MSDGADTPAVTRGEVARGAALAGLSRLGAVIEAIAQPLYTWLFGIATYGLYVVLWAAVSLATNLLILSMNSALQRIVPSKENEAEVHGAVKFALILPVGLAVLVALVVTVEARDVAALVSAAPEDAARLPTAIALFAWALPLWTFIEVSTAAARARRAFGPEIRLRIFWEQVARILFALGFFLIGFRSYGLMLAHLSSLALTAALCVPLLGRYYDLGLLVRAPIPAHLVRELMATGLGLFPADLSRRALIDAPGILLNQMFPGAAGATAAGLFEIARKLSTIPLIVRQAFQYVLAPLSSAQARADRSEIAPLYHFAGRVSTALVVPLAGLLIFAGVDILSVYRPEAQAALPILYILVAARGIEAIVGPASVVVEMTGHRLLPLFNSLIAVTVWLTLGLTLAPNYGPLGMAIAVGAATVASTYAATIELRVSDGLSPFGRTLLKGLAIALAGVAVMAAAEHVTSGPVRFLSVLAIWAATSWLALRHGLTRDDRLALGGFSRKLRLV